MSSTLFPMVELTGDSNTDDDDERANDRGIHECDYFSNLWEDENGEGLMRLN